MGDIEIEDDFEARGKVKNQSYEIETFVNVALCLTMHYK
jgi:hypothetical protein